MPDLIELGRYEVERNGETIKYTIQTVTPELVNEVVDHMRIFFLHREPMCSCTGVGEDPASLNSILELWKEAAKAGASIVALLENPDGSKGKVIGANITIVSHKDEKSEKEYEGEAFNAVLAAVNLQIKKSNLYEKYGVDKYLSAFGLSVDAAYHGCQLGYNILKSREKLCKAIGVKVTGTVFTANASQYLAAKVGFETLLSWDYKDFEVNGKYPFEKMQDKHKEETSSKMMALKYN